MQLTGYMGLMELIGSARTKKVISCVVRLGRRVTVADVATETGLDLRDAESELIVLINKSAGHLEISSRGDVVYAFSPGFRNALVLRPMEAAISKTYRAACKFYWNCFRIYFGVALIISICVLLLVLIWFMEGSSNFDFPSIGGSGGSTKKRTREEVARLREVELVSQFRNLYNEYCLKYAYNFEQSFGQDTDNKASVAPDSVPSFFREIFSYLFGDGDPNKNLDEQRWVAIAHSITIHNGVVTAEELAPFLDVDCRKIADERYVLPVLARFNGQARITENGNMVYIFESALVSAVCDSKTNAPDVPPQWIKEEYWTLTYKPSVTWIVILNLFLAVITLPVMIVGHIFALWPLALFWHAVTYVCLNLFTKTRLSVINDAVKKRNQLRVHNIERLLHPGPGLAEKLKEKNGFKLSRLKIADKDVVYRTDLDLLDQTFTEDDEPYLAAQSLESQPANQTVEDQREPAADKREAQVE